MPKWAHVDYIEPENLDVFSEQMVFVGSLSYMKMGNQRPLLVSIVETIFKSYFHVFSIFNRKFHTITNKKRHV